MAGETAASPPAMDQRTRARLRGFAYRLTGDRHFSEDIAQETLLRALREDIPRDLPYLFRIVVNLVRTESRRIAYRRLDPGASADRVVDPREPAPLDRLVAEERDRRLWSALGSIPERERSALVLRYSEEMSCSEIGRVLGASPNAVSCLLHRGKERMRDLLSPGSLP